MVTDTGKVLNTAAADHDHGVLLKVVADTGNVSGNFVAVGQANTGDLTQSGVRLLGGSRSDCGADASLLRSAQVGLIILQGVQTLLESGRGGLISLLLSAMSDELVYCGHCFPPFLDWWRSLPSFPAKDSLCRKSALWCNLTHTQLRILA